MHANLQILGLWPLPKAKNLQNLCEKGKVLKLLLLLFGLQEMKNTDYFRE